MNQTSDTTMASRATLKDNAKGALAGKYGKFIRAFITVSLLSAIIQFAVQYFVSLIVNGALISGQMSSGRVTAEQLPAYLQSQEYSLLLARWYIPISHVFSAIAQIFTTVFNIGLALFALNIACGHPTQTSDVFYGFRNNFSKALKLSAVLVLIEQLIQIPASIADYASVYVSPTPERVILLLLILLAGSILYVFLYLGFSQIFYLFLDFPGHSAGELIKQSFRIMKGHKKRFLLLELSFLPLILLCVLTFGIGVLWLNPYIQLTYTFFFLNLMQVRNTNYQ